MLNELRTLVKTSEMFSKLGWDDKRISSALMPDLFHAIIRYYQKQIDDNVKFNQKLSKRLDAIQHILDTYHD